MSTRIESCSTGERQTRLLIFLLMCGAFSGWFAYDGMFGYPSKNLAWALHDMPTEKPAEVRTNPRVTHQPLTDIQQRLKQKQTITRKDLEEQLGAPSWDQPEELTYLGTQWTAVARIGDDKVVSVTSRPADSAPVENTNYLVRPERMGRVQAGMSREQLREILGTPSKTHERTLWYVGPAAYAAFPVAEEKVVGEPVVRENQEHSESDIFMQKVLAAILAVISFFFVVKLIGVMRLRIVLDDDGLHVNHRRIPWDAMTALKTDDYMRKGWVDLVYQHNGRDRQFRLDSYFISHFKELVVTICERKGFVLPVAAVSSQS